MIALYVRVSTEKQEKKYSPTDQRQAGIAFAKQQGKEYEPYGETESGALLLTRSQLGRLLSATEAVNIAGVWVTEKSRLSRSVEDGAYPRKTFLARKVWLFIDRIETDLSNLTSKLPL
jgi:DNA invertase Pin-like site-specific DNA recombinase